MNEASFNREEFFIQQALREAQKAYEEDEVPVGAVIVQEGSIIAKAHNQMARLNDPTAHAELVAITMACDYLKRPNLSDCLLYTTLEPCIMCSGGIVLSKVKEVVFMAKDPRFGGADIFERSSNVWKVNIRQNNAGEEESLALLKSFFSKKRKLNQMERWLSG